MYQSLNKIKSKRGVSLGCVISEAPQKSKGYVQVASFSHIFHIKWGSSASKNNKICVNKKRYTRQKSKGIPQISAMYSPASRLVRKKTPCEHILEMKDIWPFQLFLHTVPLLTRNCAYMCGTTLLNSNN